MLRSHSLPATTSEIADECVCDRTIAVEELIEDRDLEADGAAVVHGESDHDHKLADATGRALDAGDTPIVLGGDCSILLGNMLALRRRGVMGCSSSTGTPTSWPS